MRQEHLGAGPARGNQVRLLGVVYNHLEYKWLHLVSDHNDRECKLAQYVAIG